MTKLTAKKICDTIAKRHNLKPEWVELFRSEGTWYWGGKAATVFNSSMVAHMKLNDWALDRWVEDFNGHLEEWQSYQDKPLHEYLEGVEWGLKADREPFVLNLSKRNY